MLSDIQEFPWGADPDVVPPPPAPRPATLPINLTNDSNSPLVANLLAQHVALAPRDADDPDFVALRQECSDRGLVPLFWTVSNQAPALVAANPGEWNRILLLPSTAQAFATPYFFVAPDDGYDHDLRLTHSLRPDRLPFGALHSQPVAPCEHSTIIGAVEGDLASGLGWLDNTVNDAAALSKFFHQALQHGESANTIEQTPPCRQHPFGGLQCKSTAPLPLTPLMNVMLHIMLHGRNKLMGIDVGLVESLSQHIPANQASTMPASSHTKFLSAPESQPSHAPSSSLQHIPPPLPPPPSRRNATPTRPKTLSTHAAASAWTQHSPTPDTDSSMSDQLPRAMLTSSARPVRNKRSAKVSSRSGRPNKRRRQRSQSPALDRQGPVAGKEEDEDKMGTDTEGEDEKEDDDDEYEDDDEEPGSEVVPMFGIRAARIPFLDSVAANDDELLYLASDTMPSAPLCQDVQLLQAFVHRHQHLHVHNSSPASDSSAPSAGMTTTMGAFASPMTADSFTRHWTTVRTLNQTAKRDAHNLEVLNHLVFANASLAVTRSWCARATGSAPLCHAHCVLALLQPDTSKTRSKFVKSLQPLHSALAECLSEISICVASDIACGGFAVEYGPTCTFYVEPPPDNHHKSYATVWAGIRTNAFAVALLTVPHVYRRVAQVHCVELLYHCGVSRDRISERLKLDITGVHLGEPSLVLAVKKILWIVLTTSTCTLLGSDKRDKKQKRKATDKQILGWVNAESHGIPDVAACIHSLFPPNVDIPPLIAQLLTPIQATNAAAPQLTAVQALAALTDYGNTVFSAVCNTPWATTMPIAHHDSKSSSYPTQHQIRGLPWWSSFVAKGLRQVVDDLRGRCDQDMLQMPMSQFVRGIGLGLAVLPTVQGGNADETVRPVEEVYPLLPSLD